MPKPPKRKCCVSKPRCKRCPIRMLEEGTLPDGFGVRKRRLVLIDASGKVTALPKKDTSKKDKSKKGKKKSKKSAQAKAGKKGKKKRPALVA